MRHKKILVRRGDRFGRVVAVGMGAPYMHPRDGAQEQWWFDCDCGERFLSKPSTVRSNAKLGWGCCPACVWCIRAAGEPSARANA